MLIMNGILGISMLIGALKFREQMFETKSVTIALVSLVSILVLTLVLPNYTTSIAGPAYSSPQLIAVAISCLVIYGSFIFTQTVRHRKYFLAEATGEEKTVTRIEAVLSLVLLLVCLGVVVFLAKKLSSVIETGIANASLPTALVGVDNKAMILLGLSVFTVMLSLNKGRTNGLYAMVLLVNLMMYIFTILFAYQCSVYISLRRKATMDISNRGSVT